MCVNACIIFNKIISKNYMSRFDRRLKGSGLKPGESTCKVNTQKNYAGMNWGRQSNNLGIQSPSAVQSPSTIQRLSTIQNNVVQPLSYSSQSSATLVSPIQNNTEAILLEEKNLKLLEVEKTAPTTEMRLITRHEIRLNTLEACTLTNNDLGCLSNNKLEEGFLDNTLHVLESNFDNKLTQLELSCKELINNNGLGDVIQKVNMLQKDIFELKEMNKTLTNDLDYLKNGEVEKVRLIVQDKVVFDEPELNLDDNDIKKTVSEAINTILKSEK